MLFSSPFFLFLYLPVLLGLYYLIGPRFRNAMLLAASVLFYVWGEKTYVIVMGLIIAVNYLLGRWAHARAGVRSTRGIVALAVTINLGLLIVFKYLNFLVEQTNLLLALCQLPTLPQTSVHLPLGISFFTFHALSYVIDIARQTAQPGKPLDFALYMTFFPHAIAGPIVRYGDIAAQLKERYFSSAEFAEGVRRFILGLAKKVLIANTVALTADKIFAIPNQELTLGLSWLGVICYTLQIYFDFSGYSDMAIGLAKMFGIDFLENFNYPYIARSITDFWRRWHISLSTWFRDYLYIPLGGNRRGPARTYLNLMTVFFLCGLWHGASWTFAAWGLYYGLFLVLERRRLGRFIASLWTPLQHVYTLLIVMVGWVFFRAESLPQVAAFLRSMAGFGRGNGIAYHTGLYLDTQVVLAIVAGVLASAPLLPHLAALRNRFANAVDGAVGATMRLVLDLGELATLSALFLCSTMMLAAGTYNPFIYFRF
jgi:alginate O-acetyltransferase complex protein AlgI